MKAKAIRWVSLFYQELTRCERRTTAFTGCCTMRPVLAHPPHFQEVHNTAKASGRRKVKGSVTIQIMFMEFARSPQRAETILLSDLR
jgi:hypothetical protein